LMCPAARSLESHIRGGASECRLERRRQPRADLREGLRSSCQMCNGSNLCRCRADNSHFEHSRRMLNRLVHPRTASSDSAPQRRLGPVGKHSRPDVVLDAGLLWPPHVQFRSSLRWWWAKPSHAVLGLCGAAGARHFQWLQCHSLCVWPDWVWQDVHNGVSVHAKC
jgi:hypothetical protein